MNKTSKIAASIATIGKVFGAKVFIYKHPAAKHTTYFSFYLLYANFLIMKKIIGLIFIAGFVAIAVFVWLVLGSATSFTENKRYLYVYTGKANKEEVMNYIKENKLLDNPGLFSKHFN